jgi:hypothetical protein
MNPQVASCFTDTLSSFHVWGNVVIREAMVRYRWVVLDRVGEELRLDLGDGGKFRLDLGDGDDMSGFAGRSAPVGNRGRLPYVRGRST